MPTLNDLAALVRTRRDEKRLSVRGAAGTADVSPVTWHRIEGGESVKPLSYAKIEAVLDWPAGSIRAYLADGTEPELVETSTQENSPVDPARNPSLAAGAAAQALWSAEAALDPPVSQASEELLVAQLSLRIAQRAAQAGRHDQSNVDAFEIREMPLRGVSDAAAEEGPA